MKKFVTVTFIMNGFEARINRYDNADDVLQHVCLWAEDCKEDKEYKVVTKVYDIENDKITVYLNGRIVESDYFGDVKNFHLLMRHHNV